MNKIPMSRAASALFRALKDRAGAEHDRILLIEIRSSEWQSLTFTGERTITLRIRGPEAGPVGEALTHRIEEAEFVIPGQFVADIATLGDPVQDADGSLTVSIAALTIAE